MRSHAICPAIPNSPILEYITGRLAMKLRRGGGLPGHITLDRNMYINLLKDLGMSLKTTSLRIFGIPIKPNTPLEERN